MASLKDTEQLTQRLEDLVGELRSELGNGEVDFEKLVSLSDELSEAADGLAETFNSVNETLMQRLEDAKSGRGSRSRGGNRQSESSSSQKTTAARS
jgi:L-ribulose-5-phosphate 3-epimerase UlaE